MDEAGILEYIRANLRWFMADGLGWPRPGGLPKYYSEHQDEWTTDMMAVEMMREAAAAAEVRATRSDRTASYGMTQESDSLLASIRWLADEGHSEAEIAEKLKMPERCVRNSLLLGPSAYLPYAQAPVQPEDVQSFIDALKQWQRGEA